MISWFYCYLNFSFWFKCQLVAVLGWLFLGLKTLFGFFTLISCLFSFTSSKCFSCLDLPGKFSSSSFFFCLDPLHLLLWFWRFVFLLFDCAVRCCFLSISFSFLILFRSRILIHLLYNSSGKLCSLDFWMLSIQFMVGFLHFFLRWPG